MAKPPSLVAAALATWNGKALLKGKKDILSFDKQAQKLGQTFNRVFATTAIVAFSKKAIKAFADDEKAAKSLAVQLENTGNGFRIDEVEAYIASTQKLYKVLDDQLRPAFQTLLNATGSVTLSQKALDTAINTSVGTGESLETVVSAIAAGVRGQTKAIKGLNTGIDANIIASGDMNKIMAALEKRFAGQALARLDTYAGKMDALKVAAADATEIIGAGLLDALSALSKDNSIDQAANSMNGFAIAIANTTKGMGELIAEVKGIIDSDVGKFLLGLTALLTLGKKQLITGAVSLIAYDIGKTNKVNSSTSFQSLSAINLTNKTNKARKEEYAIITASNKARTEIDKLKDKFDLERIGLLAALNAATDEETKLRIGAQIAILDNNEALAKKINAELEAAKNALILADAFGGASSALEAQITKLRGLSDTILQKAAIKGIETPGVVNPYAASGGSSSTALETQIQKLQSLTDTIKQKAALRGIDTSTVDYSIMPTLPNGMLDLNAPQNAASARLQAQADAYFKGLNELKITVDTTNTGDRFTQLIAESLQMATKSGLSTTPVGQP